MLVKKKKKITKEVALLISIVIIIILVDQTLKIWMQQMQEINIIPGILNLKVSQNRDAAYGIGSNATLMYVLTNLIILGIIFKFITTQNEWVDRKLKIFLSFILAGGISNVIDRITKGYVVEFMDFTQIIHIPVFNLADICVLIGWVSVAAIFAIFTVREWRSNKVEKVLKDEEKKGRE